MERFSNSLASEFQGRQSQSAMFVPSFADASRDVCTLGIAHIGTLPILSLAGLIVAAPHAFA